MLCWIKKQQITVKHTRIIRVKHARAIRVKHARVIRVKHARVIRVKHTHIITVKNLTKNLQAEASQNFTEPSAWLK